MRTDLLLKAARKARTPEARRRYLRRYREQKLRDQIEACRACPLGKRRSHAVPWGGPTSAPVALIGEAPGYHEDKSGVPFVGKAGVLLDRHLRMVGLDRDNLMVLNTVCCRPPNNRNPEKEEKETCRQWFDAQLRISGAWLILVAGNSALESTLGLYGISQWRGKPRWKDGRIWLPIYHPAYFLRNTDKLETFTKDLMLARRILDGYERIPVGSVDTIKGHDGVVGEALRKQGWVFLYSRVLEDKILVVTDKVADKNLEGVPAAVKELPVYTIGELMRLRMTFEGADLPKRELQKVHAAKVAFGGRVVS